MSNKGLIKKLKQVVDNLIFENNKKYIIYLKFIGEEIYIKVNSNNLDFENELIFIEEYYFCYRENEFNTFKEYDSLCYKSLNNLESFAIKAL